MRYLEKSISTGRSSIKENILPQNAKYFAHKLNLCLDQMDAPVSVRERAVILSKMLDIPKQQAWSLIEGHQLPDTDLLQKIANEFEVDVRWLSGVK